MKNAFYIFTILLLLPACGRQAHDSENPPKVDKNEKALIEAAKNGDLYQVKELLSKGANINAKDERGFTALDRAVTWSRSDVAKFLIASGVDPDIRGGGGEMPLHRAVLEGYTEIVEALLDAGADVNAQSMPYDETPLHMAVRRSRVGLAKLLVDAGADLNARSTGGQTPLQCALCKHDFDNEVVRFLIDSSTDLHTTDKSGDSLLHTAADHSNLEATQILIAKGLNPDIRGENSETPLYRAIQDSANEVAEYLIAAGADVNARSAAGGMTPLHLAAYYGNKRCVKMLIENGCEIIAQNDKGQTPLDSAQMEEMKQLLRGYGAVSRKELRQGEEK